MKKDINAQEISDNLSPLIDGLSCNELFTLAGFCIVELVKQSVGTKNFCDKNKEEIYNEIKTLCSALEKVIKESFELSLNGK